MVHLAGIVALIPTTMLLTVSFFVLFALRKTEDRGLKAFGYMVVSFLWLSALLVFSGGIFAIATGRHPKMCMMQEMMQGKAEEGMKCGHRGGMMPAQMDNPALKH